jgi:hypothetical protein
MGIQTITIKTCDRCGVTINDELSRDNPRAGAAHVNWRGHEGGLTMQGDSGGHSYEGKALLCMHCAEAFRAFMQPPTSKEQGDAS